MQHLAILCTKLKIIGFNMQSIEMCEVKNGNENETSSNDDINKKETKHVSNETLIISKKS